MARWNGSDGLTEAQVQAASAAAITAANLPSDADIYSQAISAVQYSANNNIIPAYGDVVALAAAQNKTGLQRLLFQGEPGTTRLAMLTPFPGIAYGIWRMLVTTKVANATFTLEDQNLNSIWNFSKQINVGSCLSLDSSMDHLWRSALGGGIDLVKDSPSQIQIEVWFDYLYS